MRPTHTHTHTPPQDLTKPYYDSAGGSVLNSTAYDIAPSWWSWDPIWKIKNC